MNTYLVEIVNSEADDSEATVFSGTVSSEDIKEFCEHKLTEYLEDGEAIDKFMEWQNTSGGWMRFWPSINNGSFLYCYIKYKKGDQLMSDDDDLDPQDYVDIVELVEGKIDDDDAQLKLMGVSLAMLIQKTSAQNGKNKYEVMRLTLRNIRKSMDTVLWRNKLNS